MSKFLMILSVLVFSSTNLVVAQDHIGFGGSGDDRRDDRRGDDRRPGKDRRHGKDHGPHRPDRPEQRVVYHVVDSYRVQKLVEITRTSPVNAANVKHIAFTALENNIEIVEARILLDNGREIYLDGITGGLRANRTINYSLYSRWGERVRSITVRAVARNLIGSRPSLRIAVGI